MRDTRGAHRRLVLSGLVLSGLVLSGQGDGFLAPTEQHLLLHPGDVLVLTRDCAPVPLLTNRYRIGCTLPEAIEHATVGQPVYLDDGKISGRIIARTADLLKVRITHTGPHGSRLQAGRSIDLPETHLPISAITSKDLADLPIVVTLADIVEFSLRSGEYPSITTRKTHYYDPYAPGTPTPATANPMITTQAPPPRQNQAKRPLRKPPPGAARRSSCQWGSGQRGSHLLFTSS